MASLRSKITAALGVSLVLGLLMAEPADARRGGSFGSRGSRTYSQPRHTETSPGYVPPVQRSMTQPPAGGAGTQPGGAYAARPGQPGYAAGAPAAGFGGGRFGGFGGGFLGGLVTGGLIGGLMGHGWGGGWGGGGMGAGGGLLTMLIQIAVIGLGVSLLMRLFRRPRPAASMPWEQPQSTNGGAQGFTGGGGFSGPTPGATSVPPTGGPAWEIPISQQDQNDFERLLTEIQDAFGREDYPGLRERTTPEIMSYLAEELSENATHGRRNEVSGTRLLQADVGEAWREGDTDYATAAMRYESIDLMRDRTSGAVLSGDPDRPSQTVELWTFARRTSGPWKLSAIQAN